MAVTATTGTQVAVIGTEHFVRDEATAGTFDFSVDTNALADGDVLEIRVYKMCLASGTARVVWEFPYYGAQPTDDLIKICPPLGNSLTDSTAIRFSIKQTFGTGRSFPWVSQKYA